MTHENSGWAGHSATADVDDDSDVAGYSAAAIVDARRVASSIIELPRCEAAESQKSAQVPFVPQCYACIAGLGQRSSTTFSLWWCSVGLRDNTDRVGRKFVPMLESQRLWRGQHAQNRSSDSNTCPILVWLLFSPNV